MIVENWTGHLVTVFLKGRKKITLYPVGEIRVPIEEEVIGQVPIAEGMNVPLKLLKRGRAELPKQREGVYLLVSQITRTEHPERKDLLSPADMIVRGGNTIACRAFARNE